MSAKRDSLRLKMRKYRKAWETGCEEIARLEYKTLVLENNLYEREAELRRLKNRIVTLENKEGVMLAQILDKKMHAEMEAYTLRRLAIELAEEMVRCGAVKVDKRYDRYHDSTVISARVKVLV